MGSISAILNISNDRTASSVAERIENSGNFTNVINKQVSEIAVFGMGLLYLHTAINEYPDLYVCLLKKQNKVATAQVRIKGTKAFKIDGLTTELIIESLPEKMRVRAGNYFNDEYRKLPPKLGEAIFTAIDELKPEISDELNELYDELSLDKHRIFSNREQDAAVEKDALGLSLDIFGVDRSEVLGSWKGNSKSLGDSFLTGLKEYVVYEDDIISYDLNNFPGFDIMKSDVVTGVVEFESQYGDRLTVINANRKPMEKAMGVDLIYFHRRFESFIMVQYKMMDQRTEAHGGCYYNPNEKSHHEELARLRKLKQLIGQQEKVGTLAGYRFAECPLFFKLCKKIQMKFGDHSLAPGMYIPLDQWELLLEDESTLGKRGGRQFGYHTLNKRYLTKGTFVDLVQAGFVGTVGNASEKIALFIETAINEGKSVMYAIDESKYGAPSTTKIPLKKNFADDNFDEIYSLKDEDDLPF